LLCLHGYFADTQGLRHFLFAGRGNRHVQAHPGVAAATLRTGRIVFAVLRLSRFLMSGVISAFAAQTSSMRSWVKPLDALPSERRIRRGRFHGWTTVAWF